MKKEEFNYFLPNELIAQHPTEKRDMSRLLFLNGNTGVLSHHHFCDILQFLTPGDCLVLNNTKVIPARLLGKRKDSGFPIEVLLLKQSKDGLWEGIVKPGRKMRSGHKFTFIPDVLEGEIVRVKENGNRIIRFDYCGKWDDILNIAGCVPLPPYIHEKLSDKDRYQTVYAKKEGSAAAPTAGFHFTKNLLEQVRNVGVSIAEITLHVGLGTFRPVQTREIEDHKMHTEYYEILPEQADTIRNAIKRNARIIGVGTTTCRVLESVMQKYGEIRADSGDTSIFIYPGFSFKILDALITNFHLPESTLLMLVSAFSGKDHILNAYAEAIRHKYRFFSFGDAMFLTRQTVKEK
jgi:S-adenosylmethionine:tRNA ribosyltransferase-isomerase